MQAQGFSCLINCVCARKYQCPFTPPPSHTHIKHCFIKGVNIFLILNYLSSSSFPTALFYLDKHF